MKPKFRRFAKTALPALIVVPFLGTAQAGIFDTDDAGNASPTVLNNGANTIRADGGELPLNPNPLVNIISGVSLTGDGAESEVLEITAANYRVTNAGNLSGTNHHGINSTFAFTLTNAGAIAGGGAGRRGVLTVGGLTNITNGRVDLTGASITGTDDGIHFTTDGGTVTNHGTISGTTGSVSDGIRGRDDLTVTNHGSISGVQYGIYADADVEVTNGSSESNTASITAVNSDAIHLDDDGGLIQNYGSITATGGSSSDGIRGRDNLTVTNFSTGSITGSQHGVFADQSLTLTNSGDISAEDEGEGGDGVHALEIATITNHEFGTISGDNDGIHIGRVEILDSVQIASAAIELELPPTTTITNHGTITGGNGAGIYADSLNQALTVNNSGTIETIDGYYAIELQNGANVINLDYGSIVDGSIIGGGATTLNFLDGQIDLDEDRNIIFGNVFGMESINKSGPGFAFIGETGDSYEVQAGSINVNSGGLFINGDVYGFEGNTQITVNGDESESGFAELGGNSDEGWDADINLLNGGGISAGSTPIDVTWYPEDTVGTLAINGDVTHALDSESYIRVNIVPQAEIIVNGGTHDTIYNNGSYDVGNADIRITPTNDWEVLSDGTYTIIDSNNPIIGAEDWDGSVGVQFSEGGGVDYDSVLTNYFTTVETEDPFLVYGEGEQVIDVLGDTNVVLDIQHDYAGLPGLTDNQSALGSAIDASVNSPNEDVQEFIASLDYSDLATVQATLATLDPGAAFGVIGSVVNSNYRLHRLTQQHLAGVRNSETITEAGPSTTDAKGASVAGPSTTHSAGRGNAWGSLSYDWQDYDANGDYSDYDGETGAITAGFDWRITNELVLGLVLDGSSGDFNSDGFDSDVDSLRAAVYGTWGTSTGFYSDFLVGYGDHGIDFSRSLAGQLSGHAKSDTDASSLQAMWTVGYTMGDAQVKHGPFAGLEYQNVDVDGYNESGLPFAMEVDGYDVDSFRGLIGYRVDANYGTFRPYGSVAYAHEFEDGANSTTASFAGNEFRISGAEQSSALLITVGTGISLSSSLTLDVGYRGEIATDDGMTSHGGSLGLNYSF